MTGYRSPQGKSGGIHARFSAFPFAFTESQREPSTASKGKKAGRPLYLGSISKWRQREIWRFDSSQAYQSMINSTSIILCSTSPSSTLIPLLILSKFMSSVFEHANLSLLPALSCPSLPTFAPLSRRSPYPYLFVPLNPACLQIRNFGSFCMGNVVSERRMALRYLIRTRPHDVH